MNSVKKQKLVSQNSILWITFGTIIIGLIYAVFLLPKGYNKDLSVIGHGKNVAVVIHNEKNRSSRNFIHLVDQVRAKYNDKMEFCVAFIRTPEGEKFSEKYHASDASLVLFAEDGHVLKTISQLRNVDKLIEEIDIAFDYKNQNSRSIL